MMDDQILLEQVEEILEKLGVELRWETGNFRGGLCRVGERRFFVINRRLPLEETVDILCRDMGRLDLSSVFVLPAVKERMSHCS